MRVLVAIPYKRTLHPELHSRMVELSDALVSANPGYDIEMVRMIDKMRPMAKTPPFAAQARARNALLDRYLNNHDLVMWIDADLVAYPAEIITQLDRANPGGVTAPLVLIEGTEQFYDTYGYRQNGMPISHIPPYFDPCGQVVELEAVGCIYLIPAWVYQHNRYNVIPGQTEHYSIMDAARRARLKIVCATDIIAYHADLPRYGEAWHTH